MECNWFRSIFVILLQMSSRCLWKLSASFQFFQYKFFAGYSCCIEDNISGNVYKSIVDVRLFRS